MGICLIWKYNLNKWICLGLICLYLSHNLLIHFLTFFSLSHRWTKFRTAKPKSEKYVKYIKNSKLTHLFLSCSHIREYNYISFDISFWILFFFTFDFVQRQPPTYIYNWVYPTAVPGLSTSDNLIFVKHLNGQNVRQNCSN